ncbi:MAG: LemA family protein [Methylacidiphilales bacterium]|nr:LemA family protein [Candidatus Methylacidiphilales bacterium]
MPAIFADNLQSLAPFLPWVGLAVAIFSLFASLRACRRRRLIDNLPTSKTQGVFIGLVELKGVTECEQPLASYLAGVPCVYYSYDIEERWTRLVTETVTDEKGNTRTVTRQETGWTSVDSGTELTPFYVQDDTGHLLVRPEGARIEALGVFGETCSTFDPLYYGKGPAGGVMNSDGVRRFTEKAIPLQAPLFIVGQARERKDVVAPEIAADPKADEFLISVRSEEEVSSGLGWQTWLFFFLGFAMAPGGHVISDLMNNQEIAPDLIGIYCGEAALFLFVWLIGWAITVYNGLVTLRQRVEQGWGQVDIQLKRRHDLIPNLIDVVKGYRDHEATTQEAVAGLRSQLEATPPGQVGDDFRSVQGEIKILREAYPGLKANENFLALQQSLSDTEQRIALARSYFNSIATFYNTRLEVVPDRFLAALGGMKPRALMEANDFERAEVKVDFATPTAPPVSADPSPVASASPAAS